MKKLLGFLKWTAIVLLCTPVLIYLIWITGNLRNDELNPELTGLLAQRPAELNEKDNAYFDTIGLAAPTDMDPHAWGMAWFAQASANDRAFLEDRPDAPIKLAGYPLSGKQVELPCSQKDAKHTCLEEIALNPAAGQKHLEREAPLLRRFDALLDKDYREPYREASFKSEIAPRGPEFRATRLAQIRFVLEVAKGNDDAALNGWQRETAFILRQARNSHTLIDAMVATAALNRYQKLLADYLTKHPKAAHSRAKQLLAMLEPFDRSALTLRPAFASEAVFSTRSLLSPQASLAAAAGEEITPIAKIAQVLAAPLFDRQATANELAAHTLEYARITTLEGDSYRNAIAKMAEKQNQAQAVDATELFHYHNPIGKIMLAIVPPDYSKYLYRNDDVLANKRLMAFAIDLLSRNVTSPKQIAAEIDAKRGDLKHPYTGEVPNWDVKNRTLSYSLREEENGTTHAPLLIKL